MDILCNCSFYQNNFEGAHAACICMRYWPRARSRWLDIDQVLFLRFHEVKVHKNSKREQGQYPAILTKITWSIKDLFYGIKNTEKTIFVLVYFWALKRKPVILSKSDVLISLFLFSLKLSVFLFCSSIPTEKSQKIFCKRELSCTHLDVGKILLQEENG